MLRKTQIAYAPFTLCSGLLLSGATAQPDESAYTLFNRTPESQLRELNTDCPDLTESLYTVDAGWGQVERDFFADTHNHDKTEGADVKTSALSWTNINIKVGLTSNIDLQTILQPYTRVKVDEKITGTHATTSGFGGIPSRLKISFWGNDGGDTDFALMPFIKWATNQHGLGHDSIEGGLIGPLALTVGHGRDMAVMTEFDVVRNETDDGYAKDWVNHVTFSHDIAGNLGGHIELATTLTPGRDLASFDCGFTYGMTRQLHFDTGVTLGLTRATDDFMIFSGGQSPFLN